MADNEPIADAADGVAQPTERPSGKTKVMVYIPHALHRAVKRRAVDEGRSASELFTDAVRGIYPCRTSSLKPYVHLLLS